MKRREFIKGCITLLASSAASVSATMEPYTLDANEKDVCFQNQCRNPLRLAHLTDLHCSSIDTLYIIEKAIDAVLSASPDIVCITGDYIDCRLLEQQEYQKQLKRLSTVIPTYATMGNHDGGHWAFHHGNGYRSSELLRKFLEDSNISVLHNSSVSIKHEGRNIRLIGVGDIWAHECDPAAAYAATADLSADRTIIMSHNPDSKDTLYEFPWDLMLSGHTHGGQIIIPVLGIAPMAPVKDHYFVEGLKPWGERFIHVSRGLASVMGIRFNCPPEASILNVY